MDKPQTKRPLGLLRPNINPDVIMMLCTAGHVDHGKTQLVKLLTGCNTDRLKEEQERGLTIELGFAPCLLGGNLCVGIVDVPGHEKFIKTMVAGVSGIDMAVLVIAADDGVMPQTIEHVQIMELLGVRKGLVALTKTDLVAPERVQQVAAEIKEFLKETFLEKACICPVSSETGEGFFDFYERLVSQVTAMSRKRRHGVFRMPIERVFIRSGFGTVVTGIPIDGAVEVGDTVELVPGGHLGKVRGIQCFLRHVNEGGNGQCLALNVPEFSKCSPERGQVVCHPGYLKPETVFHVKIKVVPGLDKPVRNAEEIKLHSGTIEAPAKLYLLEEQNLTAGQEGYATVITKTPVAAAPRDLIILRRMSPAVTVAGGEIQILGESKERVRKKQVLDQLRVLEKYYEGIDLETDAGLDRIVEYFLLFGKPHGATAQDVSQGTFLNPAVVGDCLMRLRNSGTLKNLTRDVFIHSKSYDECLAEAERKIEITSAQDVLSLPAAQVEKALGWPGSLWDKIKSDLTGKGILRAKEGKYVLNSAVKALSPEDRQLVDRIVSIYEETGFHSPRPDELPCLLGVPSKRVERFLEYLIHDQQLVRVASNVILSLNWFRKAQELVVGEIMAKGNIDSADFKNVISSSRKYALAILDYLDARHVTVRSGNIRKLAPDYQKYLK